MQTLVFPRFVLVVRPVGIVAEEIWRHLAVWVRVEAFVALIHNSNLPHVRVHWVFYAEDFVAAPISVAVTKAQTTGHAIVTFHGISQIMWGCSVPIRIIVKKVRLCEKLIARIDVIFASDCVAVHANCQRVQFIASVPRAFDRVDKAAAHAHSAAIIAFTVANMGARAKLIVKQVPVDDAVSATDGA